MRRGENGSKMPENIKTDGFVQENALAETAERRTAPGKEESRQAAKAAKFEGSQE